jgi:hypothetical protein
MSYQIGDKMPPNKYFPFNYKGNIVKPVIGGYEIFGQKVTTLDEVDTLINNAYNSLIQSIIRGNAK